MNAVADEPDEVVPPGIPEQCRSCWILLRRSERDIRDIKSEFSTHKALIGKVTIPGWLTALLVTQLLALILGASGIGWTQGQLVAKVDLVTVQVAELRGEVRAHNDMAGHPKMVERVEAIGREVDDLKARLR